ncbi:MAG TPA: hypothetical protein VHE81_16770, partial [Lacipirellulaceae bacterium]|nr:hypothetical protein [Lacipirellulaceae bacterium]
IANDGSAEKRQFYIDTIELRDGELYVAGHTQAGDRIGKRPPKLAYAPSSDQNDFPLDGYELRLTSGDANSALKIAQKRPTTATKKSDAAKR